ncbi:MAG TPA: FliH/SctL family protein [Chloroflexota bacterium]|nr:FliH/SctL family protein [Chloroflexota bacterium]
MSLCSDVRPYVFGPLGIGRDDSRPRGDESCGTDHLRPWSADGFPDAPDVLGMASPVPLAAATVPAPEPEPAPAPPDTAAIAAAAWDAGLEEGYQEGLRRAAAEQAAATERLAALADTAVTDAHQFARALEQQLVELALAVAAKVIAREVASDPTLVVGVVRDTLAELQDATVARLRVHPDDHAVVAPHWERLRQQRGAEQGQLVADERVQRGGCVVETAVGRVDAQLDTRLAQVAETFAAVREGTL